jgi:membrane protein implicated in regulation of membrane protease activity
MGEHAWLLWIGAAVLAGLIEITSLDFFFLMLAGGALAAAGADLFGLGAPLQVLAFAIASGLLIAVVRPPLKAWALGEATLTGTAALVGAPALVLEPVSDSSGLVKLSGENWTARVAPGGRTLEVGSTVHVVGIEGATAVVAPSHELPERRP